MWRVCRSIEGAHSRCGWWACGGCIGTYVEGAHRCGCTQVWVEGVYYVGVHGEYAPSVR